METQGEATDVDLKQVEKFHLEPGKGNKSTEGPLRGDDPGEIPCSEGGGSGGGAFSLILLPACFLFLMILRMTSMSWVTAVISQQERK